MPEQYSALRHLSLGVEADFGSGLDVSMAYDDREAAPQR